MPTPVNPFPTSFDFGLVQAGKPVGNASMQRLAQEASFLVGYNLHSYFDVTILPRASGRTNLNAISTWNLPFRFMKSPGAQAALIVVTLAPGYSTTGRVKVTVNLPSGATWISANGLDGSVSFRYPPNGRVALNEIVGIIDISGLSSTAVSSGSITCDLLTTTGVSQGVARARMCEIPLAAIDPAGNPTTEPSLDGSWCLSPNPIMDGGSSVGYGFQRLAYIMDKCRSEYRKHFALINVESSSTYADTVTPHWYHTGASGGNLDWMYNTGSYIPHWTWTVRDPYVAGGTTPLKLHIRYRNFHASTGVTLDFKYTNGSTVTQSLTLPATNSAWAWTAQSVTLKASGTNEVWIENVLCSAANHLVEFSNFTLIEDIT